MRLVNAIGQDQAPGRGVDSTAARLQDDPDRAEVLGDLERSVGDKLAAMIGSDDRLVTAADIDER